MGQAAVIGLDSDANAADAAFARAQERQLNLTVVQVDLADPSPAQGWCGKERRALEQRIGADAMVARSDPSPCDRPQYSVGHAVAWLMQLAPWGVIEFVGKSDPQVQRMLRVREDIFDGYTRENFLDVVRQNGRIFTEREVSQGRLLVWYSRQS